MLRKRKLIQSGHAIETRAWNPRSAEGGSGVAEKETEVSRWQRSRSFCFAASLQAVASITATATSIRVVTAHLNTRCRPEIVTSPITRFDWPIYTGTALRALRDAYGGCTFYR